MIYFLITLQNWKIVWFNWLLGLVLLLWRSLSPWQKFMLEHLEHTFLSELFAYYVSFFLACNYKLQYLRLLFSAAIKIIFIVPETKGKSNEEIRKLFAKKSKESVEQENLKMMTRLESKIWFFPIFYWCFFIKWLFL